MLQVSLAAIHTLSSLLSWAGPALGCCCQRFLPPLVSICCLSFSAELVLASLCLCFGPWTGVPASVLGVLMTVSWDVPALPDCARRFGH